MVFLPPLVASLPSPAQALLSCRRRAYGASPAPPPKERVHSWYGKMQPAGARRKLAGGMGAGKGNGY